MPEDPRPATTGAGGFLDFPPEIRNRIYDTYFTNPYILIRARWTTTSFKNRVAGAPQLSATVDLTSYGSNLLNTCRQIRVEATPFWLKAFRTIVVETTDWKPRSGETCSIPIWDKIPRQILNRVEQVNILYLFPTWPVYLSPALHPDEALIPRLRSINILMQKETSVPIQTSRCGGNGLTWAGGSFAAFTSPKLVVEAAERWLDFFLHRYMETDGQHVDTVTIISPLVYHSGNLGIVEKYAQVAFFGRDRKSITKEISPNGSIGNFGGGPSLDYAVGEMLAAGDSLPAPEDESQEPIEDVDNGLPPHLSHVKIQAHLSTKKRQSLDMGNLAHRLRSSWKVTKSGGGSKPG